MTTEVKSVKVLEKEIKELEKKYMEVASTGNIDEAFKIGDAIKASRKAMESAKYEATKEERTKWSGMAQDTIYNAVATKIAENIGPEHLIVTGRNLHDAEKRLITASINAEKVQELARSVLNDLVLQAPASVESFHYDSQQMVVNQSRKSSGSASKGGSGVKGWTNGTDEKSLGDIWESEATADEKAEYANIPLKADGKTDGNKQYDLKCKVAKRAGYSKK